MTSESPEQLSIIKAYNLNRKISLYPHLQDEMRRTFLQILEEEGIVTETDVRLPSFLDNGEEFRDIVHVIHIPPETRGKYLHVVLDGAAQKGIGNFGPNLESEE